jgi:hypothetical protein
MTDGGPLWLKIVVASVPLIAALIAGVFALTNTVNRRVERLKNLNEVRKEFPDWLDPDYELERVILRELQAIDHASTPILRWRRRLQVYFWAFWIVVYTFVGLEWLHFVPRAPTAPAHAGTVIGLAITIPALLVWVGELAIKKFAKAIRARFDAIDIWGTATDGRVREFRRRAGLTVDGTVGPKTWKALTTG